MSDHSGHYILSVVPQINLLISDSVLKVKVMQPDLGYMYLSISVLFFTIISA